MLLNFPTRMQNTQKTSLMRINLITIIWNVRPYVRPQEILQSHNRLINKALHRLTDSPLRTTKTAWEWVAKARNLTLFLFTHTPTHTWRYNELGVFFCLECANIDFQNWRLATADFLYLYIFVSLYLCIFIPLYLWYFDTFIPF